jgi:hypothetical protein
MTRALLTGSPAIDAGDPAAVAGVGSVPKFDQRGSPLSRVIDGDGAGPPRIDIGAFELHLLPPVTPILLGDYNLNGAVDAADYVNWRKTLGAGGLAAFSGADGNGNGAVDQPDHGVWRTNFGNPVPPGGGSGASVEKMNSGIVVASALAELATSGGAALKEPIAPEGTMQPVVDSGVAKRAIRGVQIAFLREGRVAVCEVAGREDGLLSWLTSRSESSERNTDDGDDARDGQDCPSYDGAVDDAFAELGIELGALV